MTKLPSMKKISYLFLMAYTAFTPSAHATTSQFVARMYTEALGRAPDESGWTAGAVSKPQSGAGCQNLDFLSLANNFYSSQEYNGLGYNSTEKVLTLYRGLLNREPDSLAAVRYWAQLLDSGTPMQTVVANLVGTGEFAALKNQICSATANASDPTYRWGTAPAITIDGTLTADALQSKLNAAATSSVKTVVLSPRTIIYADRKITVPAGVTLTTAGVTSRQQYARMARIVRTAHFGAGSARRGDQSLVYLENGAKVNFIWVSGQRDATVNGLTLPYNLLSANLFLNGGTGTSVISSRVDSGAGNTNIAIDGLEEGAPCQSVAISDNLITGYANTHYPVGGSGKYSDGITAACERTTITGNQIVDASDVAIILFRSGPVAQASTVANNLIISAGVSAFSAMAYEPYIEPGNQTTASYNFIGSSFTNNRFWTSGDSHFDIGIAAGTRAWGEKNLGYGGNITNNSNKGIASIMQIGIGIDGMYTAVGGNQLAYVRQANGLCSTKAAVVVNPDSSRATPGSIASDTPYSFGTLDNCQMGNH